MIEYYLILDLPLSIKSIGIKVTGSCNMVKIELWFAITGNNCHWLEVSPGANAKKS